MAMSEYDKSIARELSKVLHVAVKANTDDFGIASRAVLLAYLKLLNEIPHEARIEYVESFKAGLDMGLKDIANVSGH